MRTFDLSWTELREKWLTAFSGNESEVIRNGANLSQYRYLRNKWNDTPSFYGGDPQDMVVYFREGFFVEALEEIDTSTMPIRKRKRPRWNDCEGDFRYDLFVSGDDNHFCEWTKREATPGLTVEFSTGFSAHVSAKTIAAYMRWICQALIAIENAGIDAAIYAVNSGNRRLRGSNDIAKYRIEVKREGERNDFTTWSALFSPGSYRQLGFFTFHLMADYFNDAPTQGYGTPISKGWDVRWNRETKTLEITHQGIHENGFPERDMTEALVAALTEAKGE